MEPFTTYKMTTPEKSELFEPPRYCRTAQNDEDIYEDTRENYKDIPPLKLMVSNPAKLLHLCEQLNDNNSKSLEIKINKYLKKEADCESVFLVNLLLASEQAFVQVLDEKELEPSARLHLPEQSIRLLIEYENTVLKCSESLDPQILAIFMEVLGGIAADVVSVPILSNRRRNFQCRQEIPFPILLVCFVESKKDESYLINLVQETFRFCLTVLLNTGETEEEARQKMQCQSLLAVARKLFSHLDDLNDLLREIMAEARMLTNAERCSLFLLDPDHLHLVAKVFDGVSYNDAHAEVKIARNQGIAGHVADTGKLLNIKNAYQHPLFFKGMDEATGFKTRNILCFPIRDEHGIVGVAQLCNKRGGNFDYFDEEVANAFSIYCGISIMHSLVYKQIQDAQARNKLSNELMMYHMKVSEEDVERVLKCPNKHFHPDLERLSFSPRFILENETACFVLKMFDDLGFIKYFTLKRETVGKFVVFIRRGYRDTPYHNWMHAFSVAHFAYLCLVNFQLVKRGYITQLEAFAYFISCLCHDLDHRGTTNSFQKQSNSVLANLYSSEGSVMERHHLSQTICTLNTEGCNFLEPLNREDYILCLDLIRDMILATDLATHFKILPRQLQMVQEGYDSSKPDHRYALVCLLMTCADLSDQTKNWSVTKKVAQKIYEEFFTQGDLEKKMGRMPVAMMDREKASIPDLQIEFLNNVCLPVFKVLADMFPESKPLVAAIKKNMVCWESSKAVFEKLCADEGMTSLEVLTSSALETEVQKIMDALDGRKKSK